MKLALDSIFQVAFGTALDNMCESSEEGKSFGDAFDNSSALTLFRFVDVFWRIKKFLNVGSEALLRKNTKTVDDFVYKLIHKKIEQMKKKGNSAKTVSDNTSYKFLILILVQLVIHFSLCRWREKTFYHGFCK